jgi:hypothetical protein
MVTMIRARGISGARHARGRGEAPRGDHWPPEAPRWRPDASSMDSGAASYN